MKITISDISSIPEFVTIKRSEYVELKSKAKRYDQRRAKEQANCINNLNKYNKEERTMLARKAAKARWNKQ